jgi:hypothetical protein
MWYRSGKVKGKVRARKFGGTLHSVKRRVQAGEAGPRNDASEEPVGVHFFFLQPQVTSGFETRTGRTTDAQLEAISLAKNARNAPTPGAVMVRF